MSLSRSRGDFAAPVLLFVLWLYLAYSRAGLAPRAWGFAAVLLGVGTIALVASGRLSLRLDRPRLAVLALLVLYALWVWVSLLWSQAPDLTREEAARTTFYVGFFAVALLALGGREVAGPRSADPTGAEASPGTRALSSDPFPYLLVAAAGLLLAVAVLKLALLGWGDGSGEGFRFAFPLLVYANHAATLYLVSFWPLLGLAQCRDLPVPLRAASLGLTAPLVQLALLAQSRGAILSLALVTPLAFLVLPHRLRALVYLLVPGAAIALTLLPLNAFWSEGTRSMSPLLPAGYLLFAFLAGAVAALVLAGNEARVNLSTLTRRLIGALMVAGAIGLTGLGLTLAGGGLDLPGEGSAGRLLDQGGTGRERIWDAALREFFREPWVGVGAGSFVVSFDRLVGRNLEPEQPHSLLLKSLAETGVVGAALLFGAFALAALTILAARFFPPRLDRPSWRDRERAPPAVYLLVGFAYFLFHAQIEALWFMPAVALPALMLLAAALIRRS